MNYPPSPSTDRPYVFTLLINHFQSCLIKRARSRSGQGPAGTDSALPFSIKHLIPKAPLFWQIPRGIVHRILLSDQALRNYSVSTNSSTARDRRLMRESAHLITFSMMGEAHLFTILHQQALRNYSLSNREKPLGTGPARYAFYSPAKIIPYLRAAAS